MTFECQKRKKKTGYEAEKTKFETEKNRPQSEHI